MKEIPILFSTPMVQAILEGRKTVTRRIIDPQPESSKYPNSILDGFYWRNKFYLPKYHRKIISLVDNSKYGQPGDVLWVRETWKHSDFQNADGPFEFKASMQNPESTWNKGIWKPSIHMPKTAARIWLQVDEIKVERLQDITEEDAIAEGILKEDQHYHDYNNTVPCLGAISSFQSLCESINGGVESWLANPWVWVAKFKVLSTTGKPSVINN